MAEQKRKDRQLPAIVSSSELAALAGDNSSRETAFRELGPTRSGAISKLSVMPLTMLLPELGDMSKLPRFAASFQHRLEQLQGARGAFQDEDSPDTSRSVSEESMLTQVMQWLSAGSRE
jgi:hypothetical protein